MFNLGNIGQKVKTGGIYTLIGAAVAAISLFFSNLGNSPSGPQEDYPIVTGAEHPYGIGEMVILKVKPYLTKPDKFKDFTVTWKVMDGEKEKPFVSDGKDSIYFGSGSKNKKFLVVCSVTHHFEDCSLKNYVLILHIRVVNNPEPPTPPTPPEPPTPPVPPTPPPEFPDLKYKLSKFVYDSAKNIKSESFTDECRVLSSSFKNISSAIAAGTIADMKDALEKTKASNISALNSVSPRSIERWEGFGKLLQDRLYTLYSEKKMNNVLDLRDAYIEISIGLDASIRTEILFYKRIRE